MRGLAAFSARAVLAWLVAAVVPATFSPSAVAAQLHITPVVVELPAVDRAGSITLANTGSTPIYGQLRVFEWNQRDGHDVLVPTQALSATPPIMRIDPHGEQVVRLVRHDSMDAAETERSYRVLIDEIPPPGSPRGGEGITLMLRYSVPVFVSPSLAEEPRLLWRIHSGGPVRLSVLNRGSRRAQISAVRLGTRDKAYEINPGLLGYALAGRGRRWTIKQSESDLSGPLTVHAIVNGVPADMTVIRSSEK